MIRRILGVVALLWVGGFALFLLRLPAPLDGRHTDAIVVLTGGPGRIDRGIDLLRAHAAGRMLISGVAPQVRPIELAVEYRSAPALFKCCIDLGHEAVDTRSNADETARWVRAHHYRTVRLVTSDWHLARARLELVHALADDDPGDDDDDGNESDGAVTVLGDGVPSSPRYGTLIVEYNKLLLRQAALLVGIGA